MAPAPDALSSDDLARAETLPAAWYREPERFEAERRALFGREWLLVAHEAGVCDFQQRVRAALGAAGA